MLRRTFRQAALLLVLALLPAVVSGAFQLRWHAQEPLEAGEIRAGTAKMWGERVLWVDARPRKKFDAGHAPGAVLLNEDEWDALVPGFLDAWEPEKTVVVYCDGGACDASKSVAARLENDLQIKGVFVLKGGWPEWQREFSR